MPPKRERLTKQDFSELSRRNMIRNPLFDIGFLSSAQMKVACIISKKTVKLAVDRNKIKRKMFNLFEGNKPKKPYIIIMYPKREVLYTPYLKLKSEMEGIFAKIEKNKSQI